MGGHFEPVLDYFKREWQNKPLPECGVCEKVHNCICIDCKNECTNAFFENRPLLGDDGFLSLEQELERLREEELDNEDDCSGLE